MKRTTTKNRPEIHSSGMWSRGADFITHCNTDARANLTRLLAHQPVDSCVWRSDVLAALECDSTAATVFGNWISVLDIDDAFSLRKEIDGPVPVMLLKHFVDPAWVESASDRATLNATSNSPMLPIQDGAESFASEEEADEAAAHRAHLRRVNRHRLLTGLCAAFMRNIKASVVAPTTLARQDDANVQAAFNACLAVCERVAAMYPTTIWPDTAAGAEPSAAQLGRTVAVTIADQVRVLRDASGKGQF